MDAHGRKQRRQLAVARDCDQEVVELLPLLRHCRKVVRPIAIRLQGALERNELAAAVAILHRLAASCEVSMSMPRSRS